jgi:hypothetical protein
MVGGEDNIYWRRLPNAAKGRVEAAGAAGSGAYKLHLG